jgi:transcriptional regulator with XRE-family HTH domain
VNVLSPSRNPYGATNACSAHRTIIDSMRRQPGKSLSVEYQLNICYNQAGMERNMDKTFGQKLQELRRSAGLSQRGLAEQVGVDFSYISKVENDRLPPPAADTIVKICAVLGAPADELLALTGKVQTNVMEMLTSPSARQFLRQAQEMNLTDQEWQTLVKRLKRLRN